MNISKLSKMWLSIILPISFIISGISYQIAAVDSSPFQKGDIFASVGGGLVHHYDKNGNLLGVLDTGKGNVYTTGCAFDSARNLYVTTFDGGDVVRFKGSDIPHINQGAFGVGYSGSPESIVFDADGNVYVGAVNGDNDIRKFDALGNLLAQFNVDVEDRGADWIDLASGQRVMYYTSEGKYIWRFDVVDGVQLPLFNFSTPLPGSVAYALRILPDGGLLVADTELIVRLDSQANIIQTYDVLGENTWFSLNLDPDGKSFWAGNFGSGKLYKFDLGAGGNPVLTIDTGTGSDSLYGICIFAEITSGLEDKDGDGLPDDWEINGINTNPKVDTTRDLFLQNLDEIGDDVDPDPNHKDVYVWVDWMKKSGVGGHEHRPNEVALLEVKKAFADAPAEDVKNPDKQKGINLHIILGTGIEEPDDGRFDMLGSFSGWNYISPTFSELKNKYLLENGTRPGKASVFHYALYAHKIALTSNDPCGRAGDTLGVAPAIKTNPPTAGSDFIIAHQLMLELAAKNHNSQIPPLFEGGNFMHELGHTFDLGHGGPGIFNSINYKPNHLSVMNYSFVKGIIYSEDPLRLPFRSKLDYSRFGEETLPTLKEDNGLIEIGGLHGGDAIKHYGTIYYGGLNDQRGIVALHPNVYIDWDNDSNFSEHEAVKANINADYDVNLVLGCQEKYGDLSVSNEWKALNFRPGEIGKAAALVEDYPIETTVDDYHFIEDVLDVTDGTGTNLESILYMTENRGTLRRVDQATGATTTIGDLGTNSIVGLSNRPGDTAYIYGVEPTGFGGLGPSRLVKINRVTGETNPLPIFDQSILGISSPTAYGIAISPAAPNIAVITGVNINNGVHYYLWKVNVNTGIVLGAAIPTTAWVNELAYSLDGSVLYGVNSYGQLVTVNSDNGNVTLVGDPGLSTFIEGLAVRPGDGELFAIDGYDQDRLVRLDPANGTLLEVVGSLGVVGPYGLAFITTAGADTTGVFRPSNGLLYLKNQNTSGFADIAINYGLGGDYPVVGDWDGNGTVTIGIFRNGYFYLRNSNTIGFADWVFPFGNPGDQPIAGDWDGDGVDTIGVYRKGTFFLRNSNSAGAPEMSFVLGNPGDVGIAGDWNADGMDTTGVFRPTNGALYLKNTNVTGFADIQINYGLPGDKPVTGDWNNDGIDTIGIYRNGTFYLRNTNTIGFADIVFALGIPGDMPIAGNWDGLP